MVTSSNRKYQPFPLLSYFSVVVCLRCLLHHILSRIVAYFVLIIIVQFMISANSRIRCGLQIVFVCLYITPSHYHHCVNLSVDIELMKFLPDIFCRVCEQDWAYSLSYPLLNIWGCMFSVTNYCISPNTILTHWSRDKMNAISQTTLTNTFSWMNMLEFRLKFHWSLLLRDLLIIFLHWFR